MNAAAPNPVTNAEFTRAFSKTLMKWNLLPAPALGVRAALGEMSEMALNHTHEFESLAGGTLLSDRVIYEVPAGTLGRAAAGRVVRADVKTIFRYREKRIREIFSGPEAVTGSDAASAG